MGDMTFGLDLPSFDSKLISERAIDEPRRLKVIYIGAGASGIIAAIEFLRAVPSLDFVIYEKNPEIGGTWYENRYPGCACDVPSHSYQLSFESWTGWSQFYAGAPEILAYWKRVVDKYDVRKHIRFNQKCVEARWDESRSKWMVRLENGNQAEILTVIDECDVLITGTGLLNEWKWPSIEGLQTFKGELLHTANWMDSFDATVTVIGGGSSGIQVVPALVSKVKSMDHYIRGKTWICSQISEDVLKTRSSGDGVSNFNYTPEDIEAFSADPKAYLAYRKSLEADVQGLYEVTKPTSSAHTTARQSYEKGMRERLRMRPDIIDQLLPAFPPLCKRLTPGPGYLEALTAPHVNLVSQPIARVDEDSIITNDGTRRKIDAIICATGFETSPGFGFPIYGEDGINLREKYRNRPKTYLGLCTNNFPNFFQSLGPNTWQGAGSLLITIEYVHRYIAQILKKMAYENVKTIQPRRKQVDNFTNYCDDYFKNTVYTADCVSWYKTPLPSETQRVARVTALWPGSCTHALNVLKSVRWEDFDMENYDGNDFGWFGGGYTTADKSMNKTTEMLTWFLEKTQYLDRPLSTNTTPPPI